MRPVHTSTEEAEYEFIQDGGPVRLTFRAVDDVMLGVSMSVEGEVVGSIEIDPYDADGAINRLFRYLFMEDEW